MNDLSITLRIADRPYKMTIAREEEESFRKAAKLIEEKTKAYATAYSYKDKQDLLAMVSLEFVITFLNHSEKSTDEKHSLQEKLEGIDNKLNTILKAPDAL